MNIPDKAVEAAARGIGVDLPGRITSEVSYQGGRGQEVTGDLDELIRNALEAAAPYIAAQALRDYARTLDNNTLVDAHTLHEAADELESP